MAGVKVCRMVCKCRRLHNLSIGDRYLARESRDTCHPGLSVVQRRLQRLVHACKVYVCVGMLSAGGRSQNSPLTISCHDVSVRVVNRVRRDGSVRRLEHVVCKRMTRNCDVLERVGVCVWVLLLLLLLLE